jgi:abortive infection bacteriophage resistance protein
VREYDQLSFLFSSKKNFERSKELFVNHYQQNYDSPSLPPCWMLREVNTFGMWSLMYNKLGDVDDKQAVAKKFTPYPSSILANWLHHLVFIRNICAHHGRLWNRVAGVTAKIPRAVSPLSFAATNNRFAITAFVVNELLTALHKSCEWKSDLKSLLDSLPNHLLKKMGFQLTWKSDNYWN